MPREMTAKTQLLARTARLAVALAAIASASSSRVSTAFDAPFPLPVLAPKGSEQRTCIIGALVFIALAISLAFIHGSVLSQ